MEWLSGNGLNVLQHFSNKVMFVTLLVILLLLNDDLFIENLNTGKLHLDISGGSESKINLPIYSILSSYKFSLYFLSMKIFADINFMVLLAGQMVLYKSLHVNIPESSYHLLLVPLIPRVKSRWLRPRLENLSIDI